MQRLQRGGLWLAVFIAVLLYPQADSARSEIIESTQFTVEISPQGEISSFRLLRGGGFDLRASTLLSGCRTLGAPGMERRDDGSCVVVKRWQDSEGHACRVAERFSPAPDSVRWEMSITGESDSPWSCPIETRLSLKQTAGLTVWTAWDDPLSRDGWHDPLVPQPFADHLLWYGQASFETAPYVGYPEHMWNHFSIPMVAVLDATDDVGFSLALSPEDRLLDLSLSTTTAGQIVLSRQHHRIRRDHTLTFAMDLYAHEGDWRPALAWMVERYPDYFNPHNPAVADMAGTGAYSRYEAELDAVKFHQLAFRINWKASFDFAYLGMYLPPDRSVKEWTNFYHERTSIQRMETSTRNLSALGFYTLNYFNVTEFGQNIKFPAPPLPAATAELWRDPNLFLHYRLADSILYASDRKTPFYSWYDAVAMDPGAPNFQAFLLDLLDRHFAELPSSAGICIDRTDWLRFYNPRRDDGESWMWNRPVASLYNSWKDILEKIGPRCHEKGKVIFINNTVSRLDAMRHVDGVFDEAAFLDSHLNKCAFECVRKPLVCWVLPHQREFRTQPDAFMQQHLYMGGYPMAPFPGNDHSNLPDPQVEQLFIDYGPLMDAMRGKQWLLAPHVIEVPGGQALANLFEVPGGFVVPVIHAKMDHVGIVLRGMSKLVKADGFDADALHPGSKNAVRLNIDRQGDVIVLDVPVVRGCAMVRLRRIWMEPERDYFFATQNVQIKTAISGAAVHYTLDGSLPTETSSRYTGALQLRDSATVRAAVVTNGETSGAACRSYTRVPLPAPVLTASQLIFSDSTTIRVQCSAEECAVSYTDSPGASAIPWREWSKPFLPLSVHQTTALAARCTLDGASSSGVAQIIVYKCPPRAPRPNVFISDLEATTSTVGWGGHARIDHSIEDRPLTINGERFQKGMGVVPASELAYRMQPEYHHFVAVVGIDDEMKNYTEPSVVFQLWVDDKMLEESPVLRIRDVWYLNVELPRDGKMVRLVVTDAGDGIDCDHADWADAGFITR